MMYHAIRIISGDVGQELKIDSIVFKLLLVKAQTRGYATIWQPQYSPNGDARTT